MWITAQTHVVQSELVSAEFDPRVQSREGVRHPVTTIPLLKNLQS